MNSSLLVRLEKSSMLKSIVYPKKAKNAKAGETHMSSNNFPIAIIVMADGGVLEREGEKVPRTSLKKDRKVVHIILPL